LNPYRLWFFNPTFTQHYTAMATEVVTALEHDSRSNAVDLDYWARHSVPFLSSLLKSAGSYSPTDHDAQLRFLSEHVIPNLGPRPSVAYTSSLLTQSGSPIQPSINVSSGKPQVRYCWELLGPRGGSDSDPFAVEAAREILSSFSTTFGFCTRWSDAWLSAFAPTPKEIQDVQVKLPKWLASFTSAETEVPLLKRLPFVFVAFDLKGPKTSMKAYFNPKAKEIATGTSATEMTWNVLRNLVPSLNAASIDVLAQ
jgi:DMATS type aromatic prenyltransferase